MATYTPRFKLHQWVPEDNFLRTDFNEDFLKIDSQLSTMTDYLASTCRMVTGTYTGNNTAERLIYLGFTPTAVFLETCAGHRPEGNGNHLTGGIILQNYPIKEQSSSLKGAYIINLGFYVTTQDVCNLNGSSYTYHYVAFQ